MTTSPQEQLGRLAKARTIVDVLTAAGLDDPSILDDVWDLGVEAAGYRFASGATRVVVRDMLAERFAGSAA
jgi:hypothetical protein